MSRRTHFSITDMNDHVFICVMVWSTLALTHVCIYFKCMIWIFVLERLFVQCSFQWNFWTFLLRFSHTKNWATHKNLRSNRNGEWENNFFKNRKFGVELKNLWFLFFLVPLFFLFLCISWVLCSINSKKVHWIIINNLLKCSIPLNPTMNVESNNFCRLLLNVSNIIPMSIQRPEF